jgi:hypothetical protein
MYDKLLAVLVTVGMLIGGFACAQEILQADHTYQMGDNDSRNDARNYCLLEAKKKLIERAGVYVESNSEVRNFQLEKSEIRSVSAAVIQIQVARDELIADRVKTAISCAVRASVDVNAIRKQLERYRSDGELRSKVREQQAKLQALERELSSVRQSLAGASPSDAARIRNQANDVVNSIGATEETRRQVIAEIRRATNVAWQNIEIGMTEKDVVSVAGQPRSRTQCTDTTGLNYGAVWVILSGGVVRCFVHAGSYGGRCADCGYHKALGGILDKK